MNVKAGQMVSFFDLFLYNFGQDLAAIDG
ncbi:Hypothetical protein F387_00190 [Wohlfahrtiimonas chitiniclastica SH04]|uniref:Uncharacterized protein n=1 Tax=Wohlfahrtiimonas chitiniclastica SH04 TaxID=1261130 RepID=L8XXM2_9GAMM|nr:Hypothetical protein F387_00190 [Wohlfahrtiimonas chitiniclastica SH04]